MKKIFRLFLIVLVVMIAALKAAWADTVGSEDVSKVIEAIAVPQSPAFAVLGVTPDKVVRPGNTRELALGLIQGVDERGNLQNGVALDFSPYLLLYGDELTLKDYRSSKFSQFASHVQISLGTSKGQEEADKSERLAAGLRATIFDFGDPRMDTNFDTCVNDAHTLVLSLPPIPPTADAGEIAEAIKKREQMLEQGMKKCREKHAEESVGKAALDIGFSPLWISEDGQSKNLKSSGIAAWISCKKGFGHLLTVANVQYKSRDKQPDPEQSGSLLHGNSLAGGLKVRYGSASSGLNAQGIYTSFSPDGKPKDQQILYSVGGEIKLADNLWLEVSVGGNRNKRGDESSFVSSQLKWGVSEASVLNKKE